MKKKWNIMLISVVITIGMIGAAVPASAAEMPGDAAALVEDIPTNQAFTEEKVPEEDMIRILNAGINAPSAINQQPWHFSAVTDPAILAEIAGGGDSSGASAGEPDGESEGESNGESEGESDGESEGESDGMPAAPAGGSKAGVGDSPLAIVISCREGSEFDAGLACQNMSVEAQLLGYGTKIVSSPTMVLNGSRQEEFREILGIPADMTAVAVILVGVPAQNEADIISSATERNDYSEIVTCISAE